MKKKSEFSVVIERDKEDYLVASVPEIPGCHTQAKSMDVLLERVKEAISLCLEDQVKKDVLGARQFVGVQRVSVDAWSAPRA